MKMVGLDLEQYWESLYDEFQFNTLNKIHMIKNYRKLYRDLFHTNLDIKIALHFVDVRIALFEQHNRIKVTQKTIGILFSGRWPPSFTYQLLPDLENNEHIINFSETIF